MDESFGSDRVGGPNGKFLGAVEDGHVASFEERGLPPLPQCTNPTISMFLPVICLRAGRLSMESLLRGKVNAVVQGNLGLLTRVVTVKQLSS